MCHYVSLMMLQQHVTVKLHTLDDPQSVQVDNATTTTFQNSFNINQEDFHMSEQLPGICHHLSVLQPHLCW